MGADSKVLDELNAYNNNNNNNNVLHLILNSAFSKSWSKALSAPTIYMGKLNFHMPFGTRMFLVYSETVWERKEESKETELVNEGQGVRNSKFEERRLRRLGRQSFSCGCEGRRVEAGRRSEIHDRYREGWLVHWGIVARAPLGSGTLEQQS